jgi:hypothetical protein
MKVGTNTITHHDTSSNKQIHTRKTRQIVTTKMKSQNKDYHVLYVIIMMDIDDFDPQNRHSRP